MTKTILWIVLVGGFFFGVIFMVKFMPVYLGVSELERSFNECMSNYDTYGTRGCRDLFGTKIEKNKLSLDEGIALSKALKDMANDALRGERLRENFYYLHKHWNSLSREEYFSSVRKIFEYFVRLFKDEIRKIAVNHSD